MTDRTIPATAGIHHVTTLASTAQRTLDFHAGVLGLRLVKRTVNFDDPGTWHLYFGDASGSPGTLLTLFPYTALPPGQAGAGQFSRVQFAVPVASLAWWADRLRAHDVHVEGPVAQFGETVLRLHEPDGLAYDLVAADYAAALPGWAGGTVPAEHAIRGIHGVQLHERAQAGGDVLLAELFGFAQLGTEGEITRFRATGGDGLGRIVDLRRTSGADRGMGGAGTVHHVAFRATDDFHHAQIRAEVAVRRIPVTEVVDRQYFRSIYFRTPGGALFEVATDPPGMLIDETLETLGQELRLPPQYESERRTIARVLPPLVTPTAAVAGA